MKYDWEHPFDTIHKMTAEAVIVKDALKYESSLWKLYFDANNAHPVQRQLTSQEIVLDFDGLSEAMKVIVCNYIDEAGLKFIAWDSSDSGIHIHFWTSIYGKVQKIKLAEMISEKVYNAFKIPNDINPMRQQVIRAEYSKHPKKGVVKTFRYCNFGDYFMNYVDYTTSQRLNGIKESKVKLVSSASPSNELGQHGCINYIESNQFTDGRKRLLFVLTSYYKNSMSDGDLFKKLRQWADRQSWNIHDGYLRGQIHASRGLVGCNFRHELLEELGHGFICK